MYMVWVKNLCIYIDLKLAWIIHVIHRVLS